MMTVPLTRHSRYRNTFAWLVIAVVLQFTYAASGDHSQRRLVGALGTTPSLVSDLLSKKVNVSSISVNHITDTRKVGREYRMSSFRANDLNVDKAEMSRQIRNQELTDCLTGGWEGKSESRGARSEETLASMYTH